MKNLKDYIAERYYEGDMTCDNIEKYLNSIKGKPMKLSDINKELKEFTYNDNSAYFDEQSNELTIGWNCTNNAEGEDTLVIVSLKGKCNPNYIVVNDWEIE